MRTWTRDQQNAAWRKWYAQNASRKRAWERRRRREIRQWWEALKATEQCERCGEATPECLHFHHRDPAEKDLELSMAVGFGWARERILAEVAKCEVLCANCHMKHHWEERNLSSG
jgi:hypothetical protein